MAKITFWILVLILFLVKATPTKLLTAISGFSFIAVAALHHFAASLPYEQLKKLPGGVLSGNPIALVIVSMLAFFAAMFFFYHDLLIASEVRLAEIRRRNKR